MTSRQESRLSMLLAFRHFLDVHIAAIEVLPGFEANIKLIDSAIAGIQEAAELQKVGVKGITNTKNALKEDLIVKSADYARKLGVYAKFTNNAKLAQEVRFTESWLRRATDTAVRDCARVVYTRAEPITQWLAAYGITEEGLVELQAAIAAYNDLIGLPATSRTENGMVTKRMEGWFAVASRALDNMDAAIEIVRLSNIGLYAGYKKARKVVNTGARVLVVKGLVTDALTGEPIKGATLRFELNDQGAADREVMGDEKAVVKRTAAKGGFSIRRLPEGMYGVTVQKDGYADAMATVVVASGTLAKVNLTLLRN